MNLRHAEEGTLHLSGFSMPNRRGMSMNITKRRLAWIMPGIMLSLFLAALDETTVGSAMPQIIGDLKGAEHYTWPFTAYLLTATAVIPVSGRISFLYGRKSVQLGGIMIFTLGSMLCGFAPGMGLLTAFRAVQGIGGGVLISSAFITTRSCWASIRYSRTIRSSPCACPAWQRVRRSASSSIRICACL